MAGPWTSRTFEHVALYGSNPMDAASKEDYFESLYYSSAVVGLNTSAFLEGAIVGRPVHTILTPEFPDNQEGTLHFHYLLTVGGGVLQTSRTFDEHHAQLAVSLRRRRAPAVGSPAVRRSEFIRPRGLDARRRSLFCDAVDRMSDVPLRPRAPPCACCCCAGSAIRRFCCCAGSMDELFATTGIRTDREHQARWRSRTRAAGATPRRAETKRERERRRAAKAAARDAAVQAARPPASSISSSGSVDCRRSRGTKPLDAPAERAAFRAPD